MDYRSRLYQNSLPTKIITSKDRMSVLYNQLHPENASSNQRSSYGIPCSDQKLLLYGVQARVFNHNPKPTDMPSKLKEAKRNLLNNTLGDTNSFSSKRKLIQLPKTFQEKYCELARYTGNELTLPQYPRTSYTPSKLVSRAKISKPESKAEKIKQEIMSSFTQQDANSSDYYNYSSNQHNKDSFTLKANNDKRECLKGRSNVIAWP